MSNCVHDNGEYCEVISDKEVRQPCLETPLCEKYKAIVYCKDCKHWFYFWESEKHHCTESDKHPWDCPIRDADDFCSRGELK